MALEGSEQGRNLTVAGGVFLVYVLLTMGFTYPLVLHLTTGIPRHNNDVWIALWNNWWFHKAFVTEQNYYFTPYLFYPRGVNLATHSNSLLSSALSALFLPLLGPLGAFNVVFLLTFPVGALGMYFFVRDLTAHPLAAFAAGVTYAFAPYYMTQGMAHPNLGSVQWFPYIALFLYRAMFRNQIHAGAVAGFFLALAVWSGLQLGLLAGLWVGLFVVWALITDRRTRSKASLAAPACMVLVAFLFSIPVLLPVLRSWSPEQVDFLLVERETGQTDLLAYFVPPYYHPVWKPFVAPVYGRFVKNKGWMPYVGFTPLGLAFYVSLKERHKASFWHLSILLWIILALGAFLRVNGRVHPEIPLPYSLVDHIFPFNTLRSSDRFNLLVPLSLAVLVGLALARLERPWLSLATVALIGFEYLCAPLPVRQPIEPSPFFLKLSAAPGSYAVLDLPMGRHPSKKWMYFQTIHEKPLVEGMIARLPADAYDFVETVPLLYAFRHDYKAPISSPAHDLCLLANVGVRYIFIHINYTTPERIERWSSWFPSPPIYRDDLLIVFATSDGCRASHYKPTAGLHTRIPRPFPHNR